MAVSEHERETKIYKEYNADVTIRRWRRPEQGLRGVRGVLWVGGVDGRVGCWIWVAFRGAVFNWAGIVFLELEIASMRRME